MCHHRSGVCSAFACVFWGVRGVVWARVRVCWGCGLWASPIIQSPDTSSQPSPRHRTRARPPARPIDRSIAGTGTFLPRSIRSAPSAAPHWHACIGHATGARPDYSAKRSHVERGYVEVPSTTRGWTSHPFWPQLAHTATRFGPKAVSASRVAELVSAWCDWPRLIERGGQRGRRRLLRASPTPRYHL